MSEPSLPGKQSLSPDSSFGPGAVQYELSDDLARLCLPQEFKDTYRTLAWVNSICLLFLLVGLVGLKAPRVIHRPLSEISDPVPVVFTPPEEQPKQDPEVKPDEDLKPMDTPTDTPVVAAVVAVADSAAVAFSVPVQGAVAIASAAHLATPPPPINQAPARPTQFNPNVADGGSYPPPSYPATALRNRYQGTTIIEIRVGADGAIASAKVQKSSGFPVLDEGALDVVSKRWRFTPGKERWLQWSCIFSLQ
jgi:periplasmic protein TonB